jgi:Ca2+-binding RTX toxin-like protein
MDMLKQLVRHLSRAGRSKFSAERRAVVETMEGRQLLSMTPVAPFVEGGVLVVPGPKKSDVIELQLDAADSLGQHVNLNVTVNGTMTMVALSTFSSVRVDGSNGNDDVRVNEAAGPFTLPVSMFGGNGKDHLVGGSGADTLDGGNGNDMLEGMAGDDALKGGNGKDNLDGGADNDTLDGGNSKDTLAGGEGVDAFAGKDSASEIVDLAADETAPAKQNGKKK